MSREKTLELKHLRRRMCWNWVLGRRSWVLGRRFCLHLRFLREDVILLSSAINSRSKGIQMLFLTRVIIDSEFQLRHIVAINITSCTSKFEISSQASCCLLNIRSDISWTTVSGSLSTRNNSSRDNACPSKTRNNLTKHCDDMWSVISGAEIWGFPVYL